MCLIQEHPESSRAGVAKGEARPKVDLVRARLGLVVGLGNGQLTNSNGLSSQSSRVSEARTNYHRRAQNRLVDFRQRSWNSFLGQWRAQRESAQRAATITISARNISRRRRSPEEGLDLRTGIHANPGHAICQRTEQGRGSMLAYAGVENRDIQENSQRYTCAQHIRASGQGHAN